MAGALVICAALAVGSHVQSPVWGKAKSPAVPEADGYVAIPNASHAPSKRMVYKAVFDATKAAEKPSELIPALNMAGSLLNDLAVAGVPLKNAQFAVVFHGAAVDALLNNAEYKKKFGVDNPNLRLIERLRSAGCETGVCGQYLAAMKVRPQSLTPKVPITADALLMLIEYQNRGYALMSF